MEKKDMTFAEIQANKEKFLRQYEWQSFFQIVESHGKL